MNEIKIGDYVKYIGNIFDDRLSNNNIIRTNKEIGMYDQRYWWVYMNDVSKIDDMEMFVKKLDKLMEI